MVTNPIHSLLSRRSPLIVDGALATELEQRGADLNDSLWSAKILLENPELIRDVHADYFRAGADIAITSTYQATFKGFAARSIGQDQAAGLMRLSVLLAHEARVAVAPNGLVAASVGPYGAYLADGSEYRGHYRLTVEALMDFHRPRMAILTEMVEQGKADLLACETVPCRDEAEAFVRLLEEFAVPAWLSFACCNGRDIAEGDSFAETAAAMALSPQICAVGINCTPPQFVEPLLRSIKGEIDKPLIVYPNSGEGWDAARKKWIPCTDGPTLVTMAPQWLDAGAQLIGGCCRTSPADIQALRHVVPQCF